ncbi:Disease resistance protein RPS2 [Camellia lanceoleosa]|nr:Disease resistance protein RPS2 [Camellia lanceoleosa]
MKKMYKTVINLWDEGDQIREKILVDRPPEIVVNMRAPDIKKFETLQKLLEQILDLLKGNKVKGIRIQRPLGIGKTTIMLNLNNHEQVAKMFDIVIWLKVSKEGSKENLSRNRASAMAIVQRMEIKMEGASNADKVAQRIFKELKAKKYLLLLDDVKEDLNLNEIGIPESNNDCKIVLTTRVIKVTYLSLDEAWKMFQDVLGSPKLIANQKIRKLAWRVCKECSGLPLLIEKVANTFKLKNTEYLWSDGLDSWRMWPEKECQGIREMYKLLKFCYDDLDDDTYKKCFLYGALYPEDSDINTDYLLECWAAEDLLGNDDCATKESIMIGHLILSRLKNVSLLEEGKNDNRVTMHKFIRQVALYISEGEPDCKYLVKTSKALRQPPDEKSWSEKKRISLGDNKLDWLPDSPNCSLLSTLFLQKNLALDMIPALFFEHMKNLRVLDLSDTGIKLLPSSLSILIRLKILYLNNCKHLVELPSDIIELVHLEALDIQGSGVDNIPPHIEKLICLKRLRVSFATKSGNENASQEVHFNYNIISRLSKLEELVIDVKSPEQWSNEVVENIIKEVAALQELKSLKFSFSDKVVDVIEVAPMTLRISVPKATILLSFIESSSWKDVQSISSFEFYIGCQNSEPPQIPDFFRYDKYVKYSNSVGSNSPILRVLAEADGFELVNHKDIKQLSDFGIASMNKVQGCLIESCDEIETIVGAVDSAVLPNLEHLYIKNLPMLESICKGPMQPGSLTKLTTLHLTSCQMMVKIFPSGVIQHLNEIQYLKIEKCQEIEEIIAESDAAGNLNVLPKLKELILLDMKKLSGVCTIESLEWGSLEKVEIFKCPVLLILPFNKDNAAKLETIEAEKQWWEALPCREVKERLKKFCTLSSLSNLKYFIGHRSHSDAALRRWSYKLSKFSSTGSFSPSLLPK